MTVRDGGPAEAIVPAPARPDLERLTTLRGLLALALPLAAGSGVGFFLHFMNRLFLSWYSPDALAASYPAGMVAWAVQGFFVVTCGYAGTFAAQHHAAGEDREAGATMWPALWLALGAMAVSLALIPARHLLVEPFGIADAGVRRDMAELLAWYLAETGPIALMAAMSGFFGGIGRTRLVAGLTAAACVLSIALNHWLIFGGLGVPRLGITGAGLATLATSLVFLAAWAALFFLSPTGRRFATWTARNADGARLRRFTRYALPRGGTEVLEMTAFLVFTAAITRMAPEALAASNVAFSLYLLVLVPFIGFGQGLGIAVGQCVGGGRPDLARRATWTAFRVALPVLMVIATLFVACPRQLMTIYVAVEPGADAHAAQRWEQILTLGVPVMMCLAVAALGDGAHWIFRWSIQGAGDTRWPLVVMVALAIACMAVPVWAVLALADATTLARWHLTPLSASYAIFAGYCWVIAVTLFFRFHKGPWPTMSVRH